MLKIAIPVRSTPATPTITPLSRKVTEPTGAPVDASTIAANFCCPSAGSNSVANETTVACKAAGAGTVEITTAEDVLLANGPLALKVTVTLCAPVVNEAVLKLALPSALSPSVPSVELPSRKVALPKGTPDVELTCAVKVTTVPATVEGEEDETVVIVAVDVTVSVT